MLGGRGVNLPESLTVSLREDVETPETAGEGLSWRTLHFHFPQMNNVVQNRELLTEN